MPYLKYHICNDRQGIMSFGLYTIYILCIYMVYVLHLYRHKIKITLTMIFLSNILPWWDLLHYKSHERERCGMDYLNNRIIEPQPRWRFIIVIYLGKYSSEGYLRGLIIKCIYCDNHVFIYKAQFFFLHLFIQVQSFTWKHVFFKLFFIKAKIMIF